VDRNPIVRKSLVFIIIVFFVVISILPNVGSLSMEKGATNTQICKNDLRDDNDTTPPVTTISFDPSMPNGCNGWYVSNVTVILNATDNESGVNITFYRVNGGEWDIYENSFFLNASNYYEIDFYSIDNEGNVENVTSANCKVDVVPPVTHVSTINYSVYIQVSFWATDDMSGVNHTFFQVDGSGWQAYTGPIFIITTAGSHTIRFYSTDHAGNEEDIQQITLHPHTDTIPPVVTLTVEKIFFNKWKFIAIANDADSGMDRVEFYVDNQLLGNVTDPGPCYEWIWITTDNKNHSVQAIAYDLAGNSAASKVVISFPQSQNQHLLRFNQLFLKFLERCLPIFLLLNRGKK